MQSLLNSALPLDVQPRLPVAALLRHGTLPSSEDDPRRQIRAKATLSQHGLKIILTGPKNRAHYRALAVAHNNGALARIFAGTHWAARSGTNGVWKQSLQRSEEHTSELQ